MEVFKEMEEKYIETNGIKLGIFKENDMNKAFFNIINGCMYFIYFYSAIAL